MSEALKEYFIYNGDEYLTNEYEKFKLQGNNQIYEVIRIIEGKPLFFKEHMERFRNSRKMISNKDNISDDKIIQSFEKLVTLNNVKEGNVKVILQEENFIMFFIKHSYPTEEMYRTGVDTILYFGERENPNAKIINNDFRNKVNIEIDNKNVYEAILIDRNGNITEGSRSNIFMVKDGNVITSPVKNVLPGITRMKILEACRRSNIKVIEKEVNYKEIENLDGMFISGTSPKVLPIRNCENIKINSQSNELIQKILKEFNKIIKEDINY